MRQNTLNIEIAEQLLPVIASPIRYGENGVYFWFPGSGMTTIVKDMFTGKKLLEKYIRGLASRVEIVQFWGHLSGSKTLTDLLASVNFSSFQQLSSYCEEILVKGNEVAIIIGRIDDFDSNQKLDTLKFFLRLSDLNKRRIHIIFNTTDKPGFEKLLVDNPELISLANRMEIVPLLKGDILERYIKHTAKDFGYKLEEKDLKYIISVYGGILLLTKEFLRSKGNNFNIELKLRIVYNSLPEIYKNTLSMFLSRELKKDSNDQIRDLDKYGLLDLKVFDVHKNVLSYNPESILPNLLTDQEMSFWNFISKNKNTLIDKDQVIEVLRKGTDEVTLWTIDQAISRFRKKLARAGIDPSQLRTIKGKGYIWQK